MKETILITGANSHVARVLVPLLADKYIIKLLSRSPLASNEYYWNTATGDVDPEALADVKHIIHLAGSKLNDGSPLTEERMKLVRDSRIGAADLLRKALIDRKQTLKTFVSASAIGIYGFTDNTLEIDENGHHGIGFNTDLCVDWEAAADRFKSDGVAEHVSKIRVSLVFNPESGIFPVYQSMLSNNANLPNKENNASVPWNHIHDMAAMFAFAVEKQLDGAYNSVAPTAASTQQVFQAISNVYHGTDYSIGKFEGKHLIAKKIQEAGFIFKYPTIQSAIEAIKNN